MKNFRENFALLWVVLLILVIIVLATKFALLDTDILNEKTIVERTQVETKTEKTNSYLNALEGYGEDEDVQVDPRKEGNSNRVRIKSEASNEKMEEALEDIYVKNLENFSEDSKHIEPAQVLEEVSKPTSPIKEERIDEIGSAIDNLLGDL